MSPSGYLLRTYDKPPMNKVQLDLLFHAMVSQSGRAILEVIHAPPGCNVNFMTEHFSTPSGANSPIRANAKWFLKIWHTTFRIELFTGWKPMAR